MTDNSFRALMRADGFAYLFIFCGGVWLFASDDLMIATLIAGIVKDIGGANLIGWANALFQSAAIVSGALGAFLLRRWGMRRAFTGFGAAFVVGCLLAAIAPNMAVFQMGRFLQAFAGSGLTTLTFIGVPNLFGRALQARAMGIVSVIWGFASFSGPLVGGVFAEYANWRWAFVFAGVIAVGVTVMAFILFGRRENFRDPAVLGSDEKFPLIRMIMLFVGMISVASAGVVPSIWVTPPLLIIGAVLIITFFLRDRKLGDLRLMPISLMNPMSRVGSGAGMLFMLSAAAVGVFAYAPVLVTYLFDMSPILVGYMMFSESLGWSIISVVVSGTPTEREGRVIIVGSMGIAAAMLVFYLAFHFSVQPLCWLGFLLQGMGFGALWSLAFRRAGEHPDRLEMDRISGAMPTIHRLGLGLSAALLGLVANALGFAESMDAQTARTVALWISGIAIPLALLGVVFSIQFARSRVETAKVRSAASSV